MWVDSSLSMTWPLVEDAGPIERHVGVCLGPGRAEGWGGLNFLIKPAIRQSMLNLTALVQMSPHVR